LFTGFQHHIVALSIGSAAIKQDTASAANDHRWTRQTSKSQRRIFVKLFSKALACAAFALSTVSAHATVTYSFSGFFGETLPPGQTDYSATFELTLPDFITSNTTVLAGDMLSCSTHASPCVDATFYIDAKAEGFTADDGLQALVLSTSKVGTYYYFSAPAFTTVGTHSMFYPWNPATLTVTVAAVPEPETYAYLLGGLAVLGFVRKRKLVN